MNLFIEKIINITKKNFCKKNKCIITQDLIMDHLLRCMECPHHQVIIHLHLTRDMEEEDMFIEEVVVFSKF